MAPQKTLVNAIRRATHKQLMDTHADNPIQRAILISKQQKKHRSPPPTTHQQSPQSAGQMLSGLTDPTTHAGTPRCEPFNQQSHPRGPHVSAAKRVCSCPIDAHQLHCCVCLSGGGVGQRHSALARRLACLVTARSTRRSTHGHRIQPARTHVLYRHGSGHAIFLQRRTHLISQRPPMLHGQTRREEKSSTGTPASTWSLSSLRTLDDPATTHKSSSNTSLATRNTHQHLTGTHGRPFRPHRTTASPNNRSEPLPRDSRHLFFTTPHAFLLGSHYPQLFTPRFAARVPLPPCRTIASRRGRHSGSHRAADVDCNH